MITATTRTNPLSYLTDQLNDLKAKGTHFRLRVLEDEQASICTFDGKKVINLASNNYLGLTTHPKLREAALEATRKYGVGSGAVRTIAGTMKIHMELEEKIARFKNVEACVVFQSGFAANAGTVSAVLGKDDCIISDALNHASIIDGARLSKAIGALGGYVCGTRDLIDFLYHQARPFLFSTSHPPSVAATCIAAFDVLENEPERMEKLWENTRFWKKELGLLGFDIGGRNTPASETPITPIIIGDGKVTMDFSRELFKEGVLGTGIAFPTVPEGKARIRTIMTATHTTDQLEQALDVLGRVGKRMEVVG